MKNDGEEQMNLKMVKHLAQLMCQFGLQEVEFAKDSSKIRLCRGVAEGEKPVASSRSVKENAAVPVVEEVPVQASVETINSPLVGTFYLSSAPDQPPLVTEGMAVQEGTVVCIVEAMKVMNEIKAEKSGVIHKILLQNASPVEFGTPMFEIIPAGK